MAYYHFRIFCSKVTSAVALVLFHSPAILANIQTLLLSLRTVSGAVESGFTTQKK